MNIDKNNILACVFGGIGNGFNSFPKEFLKETQAYDLGDTNYRLECTYEIKDEGAKIIFVEYGLSGIGKEDSTRNGRNFGIRIVLKGFKINESKHDELMPFLQGFVEKGIIGNSDLFEGNGESKYYKVVSFEDERDNLNSLLNVLKTNLINDFGDYMEAIHPKEYVYLDLNPQVVETDNQNSGQYNIVTSIDSTLSSKKKDKKKIKERKRWSLNYAKLNTLILLLLLLLSIYQCSKEKIIPDDLITNSNALVKENKKLIRENKELVNNTQTLNNQLDNKLVESETKLDNEKILILKEELSFKPSNENIKKIQKLIGAEDDGKWGETSSEKLQLYINEN